MTFKNKRTGQETMGRPVDAIIQLGTLPSRGALFVLYESLDGHGFFLRESAEFGGKFKAVVQIGDTITWTHKEKGGSYRVNPGLFLYDGDSTEWMSVFDGTKVKAFIYRNGDLRFVNDFSQKFVQVPEQVRVNFNMKVPDAAKFKATQAQVSAQIAAAVKKAKGRADHPYKYVSEHFIHVPKWHVPAKKLATQEEALGKEVQSEDGFITVWYTEPFHVALVSRHDQKDVRIRGANLAEVMRAANALLWSKS